MFYIIGFAVMAIGVIGFLAQGIIGKQLAAWDVLPKAQMETELYFSEPTKLPATYVPEKPMSIDVIVHNTGDETKRYVYQIVQAGDDNTISKISLHEEQLMLLPDETKQIRTTVMPGDTKERANFNVQLKDNSQQINFWTTKK